jgi:hypothetical protein
MATSDRSVSTPYLTSEVAGSDVCQLITTLSLVALLTVTLLILGAVVSFELPDELGGLVEPPELLEPPLVEPPPDAGGGGVGEGEGEGGGGGEAGELTL